jgi:hypothetical protein
MAATSWVGAVNVAEPTGGRRWIQGRGDTPGRSPTTCRCRASSSGRWARSGRSGFSWCDRPGCSGSGGDTVRGVGVDQRSRRSTGSPADRPSWAVRRRLSGRRRIRPPVCAPDGSRRGTGRSAMAPRKASDPRGSAPAGWKPRRGRRGRVGPSGSAPETGRTRRDPTNRSADNVRRGRMAERSSRLRGRNKPLKGEAQGRYRRETEPEGLREEQDARRLRKPEGVAQPGEASPVQVASRCLMRRRATKPHEGSVVRRPPVSGRRAARPSTVGQTLERSRSPREDGKVLRAPDRRVFREDLRGQFARPRP